MPTYSYRCDECGDWSCWQSIHEDAYTTCSCGRPVKKVLGPVRIAAAARPNHVTSLEPLRVDAKEGRWARDMPAYQRLRRDGTQPRGIDGSADLEAKCETRDEIELGRPLDREHREMIADAKSLILENGGVW